MGRCAICEQDKTFLTSHERPPYERGPDPLTVVDLFCGCGGLSLGMAEAARKTGRAISVRLAMDADPDAVAVYRANFAGARVVEDRVERWFDGAIGAEATTTEHALAVALGPIDIVAGGPPCQGHSDLNNHTRRRDVRNSLYTRVARAAEVLHPTIVFIENVPAVLHSAEQVVAQTHSALTDLGYVVEERVVDLVRLGVPQLRRRHVLLAYSGEALDVLGTLPHRCSLDAPRDLEWAIGDLIDVPDPGPLDQRSSPSENNRRRIAWLFAQGAYDLPNALRPACHQSDHSYVSMYGRMRWNVPAQTVTTGFGSMGQGRYVHPSQPRTITAHEAARIQLLPDFLDFSAARTMRTLATLIANAVPPMLATAILVPVLARNDPVRGAVVEPSVAEGAAVPVPA